MRRFVYNNRDKMTTTSTLSLSTSLNDFHRVVKLILRNDSVSTPFLTDVETNLNHFLPTDTLLARPTYLSPHSPADLWVLGE